MTPDLPERGELALVAALPLKVVATVALLVTVGFVAFSPITPFAPIAGVLAATLGIWGRNRAPWWGYSLLAVVGVAVAVVGLTVGFLLGTHTTAVFG